MAISILSKIKKRYIVIGVIVLFIIFLVIKGHNKPATFQYTQATIGTVQEVVSVTGTISPVGEATLAFQKSGVVSNINVAVGNHVAAGQVIASLSSADDRAALASAQASLADISRALTPEEMAVQKTALANAKGDAINAAHDGLVKAQSAVVNNADQFFTNPQSSNPVINVYTQSSQAQTAIDNERVAVSDAFRQWSNEVATSNVDSSATLLASAQSHLIVIKSFLSDLSRIINNLNPGNAGLSQNSINADVSVMTNALSSLDSAISSVSNAQTALATAQSNYDLKLAGNSPESVAVQAAKVAGAQAVLAEDSITSPIDGVITLVAPNVGEFVSAGTPAFGVQSDGNYKIEANVPEADIAKVAVGDTGTTTLDAYGSGVLFGVKVVSIDPASVVIEGVPTYKVTLYFTSPDARIRSGMTANLDILTHERDNVLAIPYRALTITSTSTTVRVVNADGKTLTTVPVTTGLKGSDGTIEIISGLQEGDNVVTYTPNG